MDKDSLSAPERHGHEENERIKECERKEREFRCHCVQPASNKTNQTRDKEIEFAEEKEREEENEALEEAELKRRTYIEGVYKEVFADNPEMHPKVAVLGSTSYVGAHLVNRLLKDGYRVNAVFRNAAEEHHQYLMDSRESGHHMCVFEIDLEDDGEDAKKSLDAALEDCTTVFDCAMSHSFDKEIPLEKQEDELVRGPMKRMRHLLDACKRSTHLERLVLTSSVETAIATPRPDQLLPHGHPAYIFTDRDTADTFQLEEENNYKCAGLVLTEKMALEEKQNDEAGVKFEVVSLLLGEPVGPLLQARADKPQTSFMKNTLIPMLSGEMKAMPKFYTHLVHVEDAIEAHLFAMQKGLQTGRYICIEESLSMPALCDILKASVPSSLSMLIPHHSDPEVPDALPVRVSSDRLILAGFNFQKKVPDMMMDFVKSALALNILPDTNHNSDQAKASAEDKKLESLEGVDRVFEQEQPAPTHS